MQKQQLAIATGAAALVVLLYFFGNTTPPKTNSATQMQAGDSSAAITTEQVLAAYKKNISQLQQTYLASLEQSVVRGNVKEQQIKIFNQLASYWQDSLRNPILGAFYMGEAAKLENSDKNLNFAARLLLGNLLAETNEQLQTWIAKDVKALYEQSLKLNADNDSARIGIGVSYIFGNLSATPMEGILAIKAVAEKDTNNMYAQMMLGYGDIRSNQLDKAVERFETVVRHEPENIEAVLNLAETLEKKGDKVNAIKWYTVAGNMIHIPEAKKEIDARIKALQQN